MSTTRNAIWSAIAVSATFGAVGLAFGHDLSSGLRGFSGASELSAASEQGVNRAAKADRQGGLERGLAASSTPTRTISFKVDRLADTSVLVRIPQEVNSTVPAPVAVKTEDQKAKVACEPVVSVLTDIAKRLPPGRCVT
jgi:hypothetical protein